MEGKRKPKQYLLKSTPKTHRYDSHKVEDYRYKSANRRVVGGRDHHRQDHHGYYDTRHDSAQLVEKPVDESFTFIEKIDGGREMSNHSG